MEFNAKQIAKYIQGSIEGDEEATISTFAKIEEGKHGAISFLANPKYTHYIYETECSIVLVDESIKIEKPTKATLIRVKNARDCVAKLLQLYESMKPRKQGIDSLAFISPKATIGKNVYIGAFAYIGDGVVVGDNCMIYPHTTIMDNTTLGNNCIIYPNASIYHNCKIGNNVICHSGSVIGADGFGFAPNAGTNSYDKIPQIGIVTIEDDVEIGANTCIDRSTMGSTGHLNIGNKVFLGAQSGVLSKLKDNQSLMGSPAIEPRNYFKSQVIFQRLPEIYKQIDALQKEVDELKKKK